MKSVTIKRCSLRQTYKRSCTSTIKNETYRRTTLYMRNYTEIIAKEIAHHINRYIYIKQTLTEVTAL